MFIDYNMSSALVAIALVCFVILCVTGTAAGGLWWAGRDQKTLELQLEANERWREEMQEKLEEEAAAYQDPRSKSFQTRKERTPGFGQLPYFPTGMYYRRRPTESALLWPYRGDVLPNTGPDSYVLAGNPAVAIENISDDNVRWQQHGADKWTDRFAKDSLKVDCENDALNSFQIRSEKMSVDRDIIKEKVDERTGTTLKYRQQFKSYHDNFKQLYRCLTGAEGWKWDGEDRVQIGGDLRTEISDDKTQILEGKRKDANDDTVMDCDYEALGESILPGAGKTHPISAIEPDWSAAIERGTYFRISPNSSSNTVQTNDFKPDPRKLEFGYRCLRQPVRGPCKDVETTEWVPFLASQGHGPRELHHMAQYGRYEKTSDELGWVPGEILQHTNPTVDPIKGLGKVRCLPHEALTKVEFQISDGLDAPNDWVRWQYQCCKM